MENIKFSVAMCTYGKDNPVWLEIAIESILNQTVTPNEVVLVVDGPVTEKLNTVIENYSKNPIFKIIRLKENLGHGIARKTGLSNCSNELVSIMDSDDISAPDRFEKQLEIFKSDETVSVVGGNITEFIDTEINIVGKRVVPEKDADIKEYLKYRCPMNLVTVMFNKSAVESVGGFIDWYCEEDYYLWVRMCLAGMKFANIPDILVNVRVGKDMYNRRGGIEYFKSEAKLQKYMLDKKIIGFGTYLSNVSKRFIVQVLMPNKVRGFIFKKFAREKTGNA